MDLTQYFSIQSTTLAFLDTLSIAADVGGEPQITLAGAYIFMEMLLPLHGSINGLLPSSHSMPMMPSGLEWNGMQGAAKWASVSQLTPLQRALLISYCFGIPHEVKSVMGGIIGVSARFLCPICHFWFVSVKGAKRHNEIHHGGSEQN